jgi:hypothetical protein
VATGDNPITPLFEDADRITAAATAAVGSGRFVKPSGNFQGGPLLDLTGPTTPLVGGNLIQAAQCVAGDKALGVADRDASGSGEVFGIITGHDIVPMVSGAATTAGAEVQSDANGAAIPLAAGRPNGIAVSAASGGIVYVKLYS